MNQVTVEQKVTGDMLHQVRRYYPAFAETSGSIVGGVLLSHLFYLYKQMGNGFVRTDGQLVKDLTLSRNQIMAARRSLTEKGFIQTEKGAMDGRLIYTFDEFSVTAEYVKMRQVLDPEYGWLLKTTSGQGWLKETTRGGNGKQPGVVEKNNQVDKHKIATDKNVVLIKETNRRNEGEGHPHKKPSSKKEKTVLVSTDEDGFELRVTEKDKKKADIESDPAKWNAKHFRAYLGVSFVKAYGKPSLEYKHKKQGDGVIIGRIKKQLIDKFTRDFELTTLDLRDYIDWLFEDGGKYESLGHTTITFAFLCSDNLISEWYAKAGESKEARESDKAAADSRKSRTINLNNPADCH